jgi:hypothetical protein
MAIKKSTTKLPVGRSVRVESGDVFIIQKDVPLSGFRSSGASLRYPFSEMLAGDSFEMKATKNEIRRAVSRASSACASYVKKNNKSAKFTVRRTGPETLRVWRVK